MSNTLIIDRVAVRYKNGGKRAFGFLLMDNFECDAVLCFERDADVPKSLLGLVAVCREEYYVNAVGLLERCAGEGYLAVLDGKLVDPAELSAALDETCGD